MSKQRSSAKRTKRSRDHSASLQDIGRPLNEREVRELEAFLASSSTPDGCMMPSMLHGFLCAVLSGPLVQPMEWLSMVWGEGEPSFESEAQAHRIINLLMRFYNAVAAQLAANPLRFEPMLELVEDKGAERLDAQEWCTGYGVGMVTREDAWKELMADAGTSLFFHPIVSLAMRGAEDGMPAEPEEEHEANVAALGKCAGVIYMLWRDREAGAGSNPNPEDTPDLTLL